MSAATGSARPTVWRAMAGNPLRFLFSAWPWRALVYVVTGPVVGTVWLLTAILLVIVGTLLIPVGIGIALLLCVPLSAIAFAAVERRRLGLMDRRPAPSPHLGVDRADRADRPGLRSWLRLRLRETATWRELGYALLAALLSVVDLVVPFTFFVGAFVQVSAPALVGNGDQIMYGPGVTVDTPGEAWPVAVAGALMAVVAFYAVTALAGARAALARALLVRPVAEELGERLVEVRASRARLADAFEIERRRIERDLHDGAQQRLTGLIMTLGLARLDGSAGELVERAQDEARAALAELRDLVRGIHPSVLTDRGLHAAVESLAERSPVRVEVDARLPARPPEGVESAAYFVIAEALANVAKHSGASAARVTARTDGRTLVLEIRDDGSGGARVSAGSGLQGLADRVAVYDGTVRLSSPPGGPTILRVEIPCES
ncbi:sensor histidine kinase [Actinomadura xylanilytica]|uniref:sensor histidine kinase n=1 Tax=Actinomadura xylanilytica TaxID=887459 RepID=UPI00255B10CB|nr:sensor histidine kinase [Actinomadura xylanilytica]MDL4772115.1 sensor domain-containing protein [Actinomadura xylanilytica]